MLYFITYTTLYTQTNYQCGFIKNHELDCTVVGHLLPWIIKSLDRSKGIEDREILARQKKYSLQRGKGSEYDERKEDSEEIARNLFAECKMQREIIFLNALKAARKRDIPNGKPSQIKANDVTDSVLLALHDCRTRHAALMKKMGITANVEVEEEVEKPLSFTFPDDDDDSDADALFPKKVRKKRAPSIKKRVQTVNEGFDEQTKKRKRVSVPTAKKDKPSKKMKLEDEEEDTIKVDEDTPVVITKSTKKKVDVAKKYKQLTFI